MDAKLGTDTLVALAAIAWADGTMNPKEAAGIRSAAQKLGLSAQALRRVEDVIKTKIGLDEVETIRMNRLTRLFTYAAATWIAGLDGTLSQEESTALALLGDRLGLSNVARERARRAAQSNIGLATSDAYDLVKLQSTLSASLSRIGDE
jgi:uncharacterized membrane protein YebE (DUF533 family)